MRRTASAPASRRFAVAPSSCNFSCDRAKAARAAGVRAPGTSRMPRLSQGHENRPRGGRCRGHPENRTRYQFLEMCTWYAFLEMCTRYTFFEGGEEVVGELEGGGVDESVADLGDTAAYLGGDGIANQRGAIVIRERDLGGTLGEACGAARALEPQGVALGRDDILQQQLAVEFRAHRPQRREDPDRVLVVARLLDRLAARNRSLEDLRIVECLPHAVAIDRQQPLAGQDHEVRSSRSAIWEIGV